jgi:hypothetical protein
VWWNCVAALCNGGIVLCEINAGDEDRCYNIAVHSMFAQCMYIDVP